MKKLNAIVFILIPLCSCIQDKALILDVINGSNEVAVVEVGNEKDSLTPGHDKKFIYPDEFDSSHKMWFDVKSKNCVITFEIPSLKADYMKGRIGPDVIVYLNKELNAVLPPSIGLPVHQLRKLSSSCA